MLRDTVWMRRAGVALALVVSLLSGVVSLTHIDGADNPACNPVAVAHDPSAHSIRPDTTQSGSDSGYCILCILCHSLRSVYPSFSTFQHSNNAPYAGRLHAAQVDRARLVAWTLAPGRAPPA
jgi:hypothetical protein